MLLSLYIILNIIYNLHLFKKFKKGENKMTYPQIIIKMKDEVREPKRDF